jgi:hypothetical protein
MSTARFFVMYACALLGMTMFFLGDVKQGVTSQAGTPRQFSFRVMWRLSGKRIVISVIALFFVVIRYPELAGKIFGVEEGIPITVVGALIAGLSVDRIVDWVLKRGDEGVAFIKRNGSS